MTASTRRVVVAVDGPSGSGKSSVSREVARRLGLAYLDTGAMYRAVCWRCLRDGVDLTDPLAVTASSRAADLEIGTDPDQVHVVVDGTDVTDAVRGDLVTAGVSAVAAHDGVRADLRARQRAIMEASPAGCVAEGRDITTVVAPEADVRVLLTADADARVARRARQVHGDAGSTAVRASVDGVLRRDEADSRVTSFLTAADGVTSLDSSGLDFEQTVLALLGLVDDAVGRRRQRA